MNMRIVQRFWHSLFTLIAVALVLYGAAATAIPNRALAQENPVEHGFDVCVFEGITNNKNCRENNIAAYHINAIKTFLFLAGGSFPGITTPIAASPSYIAYVDNKSLAAGIDNTYYAIYANPPAHLAYWVRDTGESLGFIPRQSYAQAPGVGFAGLAVVLPIWKVFRNLAYLLLALVMVVIGFMVMFRKKIDAKTVVTVQNAIPRIIVAVILITFSYAIAGLMVDLMYISIMLVTSIIEGAARPGTFPDDVVKIYSGGNFGTVFAQFVTSVTESLDDIWGLMTASTTVNKIAATAMVIIGFLTALKGGVEEVAKTGAGVVIVLLAIIVAAVIFALLRILVMLISAYIQIIIAIIFAPLQLMTSALPGSKAFENWIKNLISNLLVFPMTTGLLLIGQILVTAEEAGTPIWGPPLLSPTGARGMTGIIGLGLLFAIPSIIGSVKQSFKVEPFIQAGPSAIVGPLASAGSTIGQGAYQFSMIRTLFPRKEGGGGGGGAHG